MKTKSQDQSSAARLMAFLNRRRPGTTCAPTAVSLFSGAGISDMGYELAGFRFQVQVERDEARSAIGARNFPHSTWITKPVELAAGEIVAAYQQKTAQRLDLLVATPPCQGMSSSNPSRGKRRTPSARANDEKNSLILRLVPVAQALRPRVIVSENVRQILTHTVSRSGNEARVLDLLAEELPEYTFFETCVNVADYGIPQTRFRALVVGVHRDEAWLPCLDENRLAPWPRASHGQRESETRQPWLTVRTWFQSMQYAMLSSESPETAKNGHPLHCVPNYDAERHLLISSIPPHSGRSAYENDSCPCCGVRNVPAGLAACPECAKPLTNRPIVHDDDGPRLIKGFDSSYRRMRSDEPAPTVTTNSSHVGSDNKIHPWENRVLSILECADLQTVPRFFDWSFAFEKRRVYLIRNVIGEAFPTFFAYLHGRVLRKLLQGEKAVVRSLASRSPRSAT